MKLCWLGGVLIVALCKGSDVIEDRGTVSTMVPQITNKDQEPPPETNKSLTKRQIVTEEGKIKQLGKSDKEIDNAPNWAINQNPKGIPFAKFSSAGKRYQDNSYENKRAKFSSWAGKRSPELNVDPPEYSKRTKFSSWAGKRNEPFDVTDKRKMLALTLAGYAYNPSGEYDSTDDQDNTQNGEKRKFSSWGGKRDDGSYENKRRFSSWSGKRDFNQEPYSDLNSNLYLGGTTPSNVGVDLDLLKALLSQRESNINKQPDNYDLISLEDLTNAMDKPEYNSNSDADVSADKRTRFSSWGGKRKFSSWGGKRSDQYIEVSPLLEDNMSMDKRAKFSSWAGKRGLLPLWKTKYQGKRGKFSSWAGKRSDHTFDDLTELEKRGRFSSWGGKRSFSEPDFYGDKRAKFSSWAGKRFDRENDEYFTTEKRDTNWAGLKKKIKGRGFSSWGGKRSYSEDEGATDLDEEQHCDTDGFSNVKRATKFSSWAGKRSDLFDEEKRKFSSWGGKRSYFDMIGVEPKRARFSSWAGKRSVDPNEGPQLEKRKDNKKNVLLRRYNRFNSWRGKKDNVTPINSTEQTTLEDVDFNLSGDPIIINKSKRGSSNYFRQFELIKRNPLLRGWIGRNYPDIGLMTWKRRPAFSSWGGKRSLSNEILEDTQQTYDDVNSEKRTRFSSWGGKRHSIDKRSEETSTGDFFKKLTTNKKDPRSTKQLGTRTTLESRFYLRSSKNGFLAPVIRPMRRQFYAWGGKRAPQS